MTAEERQIVLDEQWSAVRRRRNELLLASDWTQLTDSPTDKATWAVYRQNLRDITAQVDPFNLVWPIKPSY
jgi:hypothetical protein